MKQDDYDFVEAILFYLYLLPQYFLKSELSSKTLGKFQTFQELFTKSPITHHLKEYLVINQFRGKYPTFSDFEVLFYLLSRRFLLL